MRKRMVSSLVEIVLGIVLIFSSMLEGVDEYWSSMGITIMIVGFLFLIKSIRYKTNEEYREKLDIEVGDERNKYLSLKAWGWAGYLFVLTGAVGSIVCKIAGREDLMMMASGSVCLVMVFYWICYIYLKKKY